jgi:hypothetical protein
MADFVVETTNESGVVEQERVSLNKTVLRLNDRKLVRIDGLERATKLQKLFVHRANQRISGVKSHALSFFSFSWMATASSTCQRVCSH